MSDERMASAYHEAGHVTTYYAMPGSSTITHAELDARGGGFVGNWLQGEHDVLRLSETGTTLYLPEAVAETWQLLMISLAGPIADLRRLGLPPTWRSIRTQAGGGWDLKDARGLVQVVWPDHRKEAMRRAREAAIEVLRRPDVWSSIEALASYLHDHGKVSAVEADVIVRRHLPWPLAEVPGADWAARHARIDLAAANSALARRKDLLAQRLDRRLD